MAQVLIRDLDDELVARLKLQAKEHGRSLQAEAKLLLERGTTFTMTDARAVAKKWQKHFGNRRSHDSAKLIREDRER